MKLSFKQREGLEELPRALKKDEFPDSLRIAIWNLLYTNISPKKDSVTGYGDCLFSTRNIWKHILLIRYQNHRHKRLDLYHLEAGYNDIKDVYCNYPYSDIYNDLDYIISLDTWELDKFRKNLKKILDNHQCYYTIFFEGKDCSIAPRGTEQEKNSIEQCYKDLKENNKFNGAKKHLVDAVGFMNNSEYANSIRESIGAVESVCKVISNEPSETLTGALQKLVNNEYVNKTLKEGFKRLYNYTSDEKGIRHSLFEENKAKVDSVDAQYMIGSCASFISYLINKANNCGLLKKEK